jgi:hypothetical protein
MRTVLAISLASLVVLIAAGCTASGSGSSDDPAGSAAESAGASTPGPTGSGLVPVTPDPGSPGSGSGSLTPAIVDPIIADAASRAGVPVSEVTLVSAEAVTWPDGGLGCPLPGMVYPQVVVDGYQVIVEADGRTYDYRGSSVGKFRLCTPA